jgi:hypothetical protein
MAICAYERSRLKRRRRWAVAIGVLIAVTVWQSPAIAARGHAVWDHQVLSVADGRWVQTTAIKVGQELARIEPEQRPLVPTRYNVTRDETGACWVIEFGVRAECDALVTFSPRKAADGEFQVTVESEQQGSAFTYRSWQVTR